MTLEARAKPRVIREPHALRDELAIFRRARQRVRLRVIQILQPVLEVAQEHVGCGELVHGFRGEQTALGEERQYRKRRVAAQRRIATAADQLEELNDELDLANAARTELDVVGDVAALDFD